MKKIGESHNLPALRSGTSISFEQDARDRKKDSHKQSAYGSRLNLGPPDYESVALYGIEKLRFPMQPTELQVLCKRLQTC